MADPVQCGVGEDGVVGLDRFREEEIGVDPGKLRVAESRLFEEDGGGVESRDQRAGGGELGGEVAEAAAEIENSLTGLWREEMDEALAGGHSW